VPSGKRKKAISIGEKKVVPQTYFLQDKKIQREHPLKEGNWEKNLPLKRRGGNEPKMKKTGKRKNKREIRGGRNRQSCFQP